MRGTALRVFHCFKIPSLVKSSPTREALRRMASAMLVAPVSRRNPIVAFRIAAITWGPDSVRIRLASSPIVTSRTECERFSMSLAQYPPRNKLCEASVPSDGRQDGTRESSATRSRDP